MNKTGNDTQLDHLGNITDDLLIVVEQLIIDHVDLTNNLSKISVYKDTTGKVHKTFNYITFNGEYTIKIHKNLLYTDWMAGHL